MIETNHPVICWFSGGITSAVACKLTLEKYSNCRVIFMDTNNEDDDTYRFMKDCEKWYGQEIEVITSLNEETPTIQDVWIKNKSLNVARGAVCSARLKRDLREKFMTHNEFSFQVFGFDISEPDRIEGMRLNNPHVNPIFPLEEEGMTKQDCIDFVNRAGIKIPNAYRLGFNNNNCLKTGCVQGGIGYWQKMKREFPEKFNAMADMEHYLTDLKGKPVTMLLDRGKGTKKGQKLFLKKHPDYPEIRDISCKRGREPRPLNDCNGFCGINDLKRNPVELEINFEWE